MEKHKHNWIGTLNPNVKMCRTCPAKMDRTSNAFLQYQWTERKLKPVSPLINNFKIGEKYYPGVYIGIQGDSMLFRTSQGNTQDGYLVNIVKTYDMKHLQYLLKINNTKTNYMPEVGIAKSTCPLCDGTGRRIFPNCDPPINEPCPACRGKSDIQVEYKSDFMGEMEKNVLWERRNNGIYMNFVACGSSKWATINSI